jgi:hypothetical protein
MKGKPSYFATACRNRGGAGFHLGDFSIIFHRAAVYLAERISWPRHRFVYTQIQSEALAGTRKGRKTRTEHSARTLETFIGLTASAVITYAS